MYIPLNFYIIKLISNQNMKRLYTLKVFCLFMKVFVLELCS